MAKRDEAYLEYIVHDVLGHMEGITAKAMFSGWGIYLDGVIVGIIAEGEIYLKADQATAERYKRAGLYPFTYTGHQGKTHELGYISVPAKTLDDREAVRDRVLESYAISLAAAKSKKRR